VADGVPAIVPSGVSALFGHGMDFADDLLHTARSNPRLPCILTDTLADRIDAVHPNLCTIDWHWDEGAFVAGVLAAQLSETGTVGFLGGAPCRTQDLAMSAFVRGARFERRDIHTVALQAGSFDNEERGGRLAAAMFCEGVDVLLHTADSTGRGAIRAAQDHGRTMIGFMNRDDRDHSCVAAIIGTDVQGAITELIADVVGGRFRSGVIDCGFTSGRETIDLSRRVPDVMRLRVNEVIAKITEGGLRVRAM